MAPILVVGGGAAGLLAAIAAARNGADTLLLEKMARTGRKIAISGRGRCNITNAAPLAEFLPHFGRNGRFLRQCFGRFFSADILELLEENGVASVLERGGRWFPASGKATDVVRALTSAAEKSGVTIRRNTPVEEIVVKAGAVCGVKAAGRVIRGSGAVLATGGRSWPGTGSTGDGYALATAVGHTVTPLSPALVPLVSSRRLTPLNGLSLRNISLRLFVDGKRRAVEFGEIAFRDGKITGPLTLTLSGRIVRLLKEGRRIELAIDLKPALVEQKLDARIRRDLKRRCKEQVASLLRGLLPAEMVPLCMHDCALHPDLDTARFPAKKRAALVRWLKDFRLPVVGFGDWTEAIVTAGGVSLQEVDPLTMQSRLINGLWFAGELLDLAAETGGYNLQCAFSTGWVAGESAAGSRLFRESASPETLQCSR